jgi:hypothetical protein
VAENGCRPVQNGGQKKNGDEVVITTALHTAALNGAYDAGLNAESGLIRPPRYSTPAQISALTPRFSAGPALVCCVTTRVLKSEPSPDGSRDTTPRLRGKPITSFAATKGLSWLHLFPCYCCR